MAQHKSSLLPQHSMSMGSHGRGRTGGHSSSRGLVVLLCMGLVVGAVQGGRWRSHTIADLALARRSSAQFEAMYRSATEEGASWRTKYDQVRRREPTITVSSRLL
jgi:hypothetical protein